MPRWSLVLTSLACACQSLPHLPDATLARLRQTPGGYLEGAPVGLHPPLILNQTDFIYDARWAEDSGRLALSRLGRKSFDVQVWALEQPPRKLCEAPVVPHAFDVEAVGFSGDGRWVAAVSRDGWVRAFDAATGQSAGGWQAEEPLVTLAFHPDGHTLAVGSEQGTVSLLRLEPGPAGLGFDLAGQAQAHQGQVRGLAFAPDGRLFTAGWDKTVAVYSPGLTLARRFSFPAFVNDLSVDRAGKVLGLALSEAKGERNREVYEREKRGEVEPEREWDVGARVDADTGEVLQKYRGHRGVVATAAVSPDGATLATGGWDKQVLLHVGARPLRERFGWALRRVRFSPDGRWLAVAAWTPQNPAGDKQSDPSALAWELAYGQAGVGPR